MREGKGWFFSVFGFTIVLLRLKIIREWIRNKGRSNLMVHMSKVFMVDVVPAQRLPFWKNKGPTWEVLAIVNTYDLDKFR